MSLSAVELINAVPNIENSSYLEIGVWDGKNHKQIKSKDKASVDVGKPADFMMSSDEFFRQNKRKWDIIFIDACHRLDYGLRDYNNSAMVCNKAIFMHDLFPDTEYQANEDGRFAGDVYKILYYMAENKKDNFFVLNYDCGMTLILPPFEIINPNKIKNVSYKDLCDLNIKRYTTDEMIKIIREKI